MNALIRVEQGDICMFAGDAVVNAANNHLRMGAGVAGSLLARGGPIIQSECDEIIRREGPLPLGSARATGAGGLPVRNVIHAAAMGDEPPSARSIRAATRGSLEIAVEHGHRSLAFPILGAGIGGFPFEEAARVMIDEIRSFDPDVSSLDTIVLYGYDDTAAQALRRLLT